MGKTRNAILRVLSDGMPRSSRYLVEVTGFTEARVYNGVSRCWKAGFLLRTEKCLSEINHFNDGRAGLRPAYTRPYHLYVLRAPGVESLVIEGNRFVAYSEEFLDPRGGGSISKAKRIKDYLRDNCDDAFFTKDIVEELGEFDVVPCDMMPNIRRYERNGLVYVRGYNSDTQQSPFRRGYVVTWVDQSLSRDQAIDEAIERTEKTFYG